MTVFIAPSTLPGRAGF